MKKKFLTLSIIMLLITALLTVNSYAAEINSATVTITPSKTEYKSGETIEFTVSLKDLQASSGILGLGAYLDYDSNLLTLNRVATGLSGWTDADVSEKTNRFATTKNSHSSNNEDILVFEFTAKAVSSDASTSVGLKKVQISNGSEYDIDEVKSNNISIKTASDNPENPSTGTNTPDNPSNPSNPSNPGSTDTPDNPSNPTNPSIPSNPTNPSNPDNSGNSGDNNSNHDSLDSSNNSGSSSNQNNQNNQNSSSNLNNDDTNPPSIIPALGVEELYLPVFISIVAVIALVFFIKIRFINKKINKEKNNILDKDNNE